MASALQAAALVVSAGLTRTSCEQTCAAGRLQARASFGANSKKASILPSKLGEVQGLPSFQTRRGLPLEDSRSCITSSATSSNRTIIAAADVAEEVYFDGGPHYGDLIVNLFFGLSGVWLPLTLASAFRCLFLRYRFTNKRVTVMSGVSDSERQDFPYSVVTDVKYVPRFIGEWGDIAITLENKSVIELKCVPQFKLVAKYCEEMAKKARSSGSKAESESIGF